MPDGVANRVTMTGPRTITLGTMTNVVDQEVIVQNTHDHVHTIVPNSGSGNLITLRGRLLYEDHRRKGAFHFRRDINGNTAKDKDSRGSESEYLLGAYRMVVDIYEHDQNWMRRGCTSKDYVTSATVSPDGYFSATFAFSDDCRAGDWNRPKFSLRARTRFCNSDICYQVGPRKKDSFYELSFRSDNPVGVNRGTTHDFGILLFSPAGKPAKNDYSRAANNYASLVETIVTLHEIDGIPFRKDRFGAVQVRFPSRANDGQTPDYDLIEMNSSGWPKGNKMMHEYGHIIHRRAWGGDYAGKKRGVFEDWSPKSYETPFTAFKEGWANFISQYVRGVCTGKPDTNYDFPSTARDIKGNNFVQNHTAFFCDWTDGTQDRRPGVNGAGDIIHSSMHSLWSTLDMTDEFISAYDGHDPVETGLGICDFIGMYLEVEKSSSRVSETARDQYEYVVASLLEQHDMLCTDVPAPEDIRTHDLAVQLRPVHVDDTGLDQSRSGTRTITMEVSVENVHEFIATDLSSLRVAVNASDVDEVLHQGTITSLEAGEKTSIQTTLDVQMVNGRFDPVVVEAEVIDRLNLDIDPSNNVASVTLDRTTLLPNLRVSVRDVHLDEEARELSFVMAVHNDGLVATEFAGHELGDLRPSYEIVESTGLTHSSGRVLQNLGVGESVAFSHTIVLSEAMFEGYMTWLFISIDTTDAVPEIDESDNTAAINVLKRAFIELPTSEVMTPHHTNNGLIRASAWVSQMQHDMLKDFERTRLDWQIFTDPIDQSIAKQWAESQVNPRLDPSILHQAVSSPLFVDSNLMPNALTPWARDYARHWRAAY
ncbi:MAG: hypothetical protein VX589_16985 [Myxococcota bacterium]|nr:hypothetical protein [Myxococcota bacterium]